MNSTGTYTVSCMTWASCAAKVAGVANEAVRIAFTDAGYRVGCYSPTVAADQSSCWSAAARLGCPSSARPWLTPTTVEHPGRRMSAIAVALLRP